MTVSYTDKLDKICRYAVEKYGKDSQIDMMVGEIGEFLTLIGRRRQDRDSYEQWVDEVADLVIMSRQMCYVFGTIQVEERINEKLDRLANRMGVKYEDTNQRLI